MIPLARFRDGVISIHSLRMEGDNEVTLAHVVTNISIHSLRMEGDNLSC